MRTIRRSMASLLIVAILTLAAGCFLFSNHPPVAAFVVNYNVTEDPLVVELDAMSSSDPDGDEIASYMWTFDDPGVDVLTPLAVYSGVAHVPQILVRFLEEGTYTVRLLVVDERGEQSEAIAAADVTVPSIRVVPMP